jgi:hypothetical protein
MQFTDFILIAKKVLLGLLVTLIPLAVLVGALQLTQKALAP